MQLLKKATDPMFWKSVREKECFAPYVKEVLSMWENTCKDKPIPSLRYSDFKQFTITGSRKEYEDPYFARRHALDASALLSLIYPENEEYFNRLMDEIFAICDEYTWCVPAHHGAIDIENPNRIDLFAAETGFALAEIYTMLEDRLDPLIKSRVRTEIDRRIISPFCSVDRYGFWENGTTNWTAVCVGSVACTCMLMRPELVFSLKPRFDRAMEFYLRGFEDDGICTEGCGYWHYGFGFFVVYADMIKTFTKGETDYFKLEKIKTIATFIQKMFLSENACVSFADGHPTLRYHLGLVHYLKSVYPDDVVIYDRKYSYNYDHCGRFCLQLRAAIWYDEAFETASTPKENVTYYGEDAEWFVHKTPLYGFAAKGGHNEENHNHNDVGSFIFAKDGVQVLTDPGPALYTRQYFTAGERYTFFHSASRGHSVPIIGGAYQQTGIEYKANNSCVKNDTFTTDIAGAYGIAELHSLSRRFDCKEDSVTVCDTISYEGKGKITERLVCAFEPIQKKDGILSVHNCEIVYEKENVASVSIARHTFDGKPDCFTIDFELKEGAQTFTFTVK